MPKFLKSLLCFTLIFLILIQPCFALGPVSITPSIAPALSPTNFTIRTELLNKSFYSQPSPNFLITACSKIGEGLNSRSNLCLLSFHKLRAHLIYGSGIDELLKMRRNNKDYFYLYDGLGSVTAITDTKPKIVESYTYDIYGSPTIKNPSGQTIPNSAIGNRVMFTGREYDSETKLYHLRSRTYSSQIGRFLQRDPIGYYDSMNLFSYCSNNPVNYVDPYGFWGIQFGDFNIGYGEPTFLFNGRSVDYFKQSLYATANGIIPFFDPFKGKYSECDRALQWSESLGAVSRNLFITAAFFGLFSAGSNTVLYSGKGMLEAAKAGKGIGIILGETMGGKALAGIEMFFGKQLPGWVWKIASAIFAGNASGEVQAFLNNPRATSIYLNYEKPIIEFLKNATIIPK